MHTTIPYATRRNSVSTALSIVFAVIAMTVLAGKASAASADPARVPASSTQQTPMACSLSA